MYQEVETSNHLWIKIMPKLKTNKGAVKRFRKTKTGKFKRSRAFSSHLLSTKDRKRKRGLRKSTLVFKGDIKKISGMLPYA